MSDEDLQLLVTLDDPGEEDDEDTFNHHQAGNTFDDRDNLAFGEGDWTCTLSRFTGTTNNSRIGLERNVIQPPKNFEIEVCTVTCSKGGEILEQKVFYNLVGVQR